MAKRVTWWQAAVIVGISDRQMRHWHPLDEKVGYDGLWDRRRGISSSDFYSRRTSAVGALGYNPSR